MVRNILNLLSSVKSIQKLSSGHHLWTELLDQPLFDCVWINGRHYNRDIGDGVPRTTVKDLYNGFQDQFKLRKRLPHKSNFVLRKDIIFELIHFKYIQFIRNAYINKIVETEYSRNFFILLMFNVGYVFQFWKGTLQDHIRCRRFISYRRHTEDWPCVSATRYHQHPSSRWRDIQR